MFPTDVRQASDPERRESVSMAEVYRNSPYEFMVTAETTSYVLICGQTETVHGSDPVPSQKDTPFDLLPPT